MKFEEKFEERSKKNKKTRGVMVIATDIALIILGAYVRSYGLCLLFLICAIYEYIVLLRNRLNDEGKSFKELALILRDDETISEKLSDIADYIRKDDNYYDITDEDE